MKVNHTLAFISPILIACFAACDPVNTVGFINKTNEPVMVEALTTIYFQSDTSMVLLVTPGKDSTWARFVINPDDTVICGQTIAEIDDEMPFTQLKIYMGNDSTIAINEAEVKELFRGGWYGSPYYIELEK